MWVVVVIVVGLVHVELCQRGAQVLLRCSVFIGRRAVWQGGGIPFLRLVLVLVDVLLRVGVGGRVAGQVQAVPVAQVVVICAHLALLFHQAVALRVPLAAFVQL